MRQNNLLAGDVDINELAVETKNFSGAELEGLVRAAQSTAMNRHIKVRVSFIRPEAEQCQCQSLMSELLIFVVDIITNIALLSFRTFKTFPRFGNLPVFVENAALSYLFSLLPSQTHTEMQILKAADK